MKSDSLRLAAVESQVRRLPRSEPESSGPNFLSTAITILDSTSAIVPWQTFNAADYVPNGTKTAIVETEWSISEPDSQPWDAYIRFRKNIDSVTLVGSRGRAAGNSDNIAGANQLLVPLTDNRSFDFVIEKPGFNNGALIRLVGYFA